MEAKDEECYKRVNEMQVRQQKLTDECDDKIKKLVEGFRTDMAIVDREMQTRKDKFVNENEQLRVKLASVTKEASELGSLLEAAVKSDTRKEAII